MRIKFYALFINLLIISFLISVKTYAQNDASQKLSCVVIDAGHGGSDPGAQWSGIKEKDITLSVALQLGELINKHYPEVNVVYTRKKDVAVPLATRSQIANDAKADLFISIHVNSARNSSARGVETFVMGYDHTDKNMEVAQKENSVITFEDDYESKYEGFDPGSSESYIVFSLMQYSYLDQSSIFATSVQDEYIKLLSTPNRGVKQAGFLVLWRTTMPSVLTELGFLSNTYDRKYLTNKESQYQLAQSLYNSFARYKSKVEGVSEPSIDKLETIVAKSPSVKSVKDEDITYKVRIASTKSKKALTKANFGSFYSKMEVVKSGAFYLYYIKAGGSYSDAQKVLKECKSGRYKDAFIVAYRGGERMDLNKARKLTD